MRLLNIAFAVLILNSCLLLVNDLAPMGAGSPAVQATDFGAHDFDTDINIPTDSTNENSESFLRRALGAVFGSAGSGGFIGALKNTIFIGGTVEEIMTGYLGLELPHRLIVLLDAMSSFVLGLGMWQLFMRFRAE